MEYEVTAQPDHIAKLKAVKKPILAVAELVWNAFDEDAERVDVEFEATLGAISAIVVSDNGWGMTPEDAKNVFRSLGGSWKRTTQHTKRHRRAMHGKEGKGRFKSLGLGTLVEWAVCYGRSSWLRLSHITPANSQHFRAAKKIYPTPPAPSANPITPAGRASAPMSVTRGGRGRA